MFHKPVSYESKLLRQAYNFITAQRYWYMDPTIVDWVLSVECHGTVADRFSRAAPFLIICEEDVTTIEFNVYPNSKLRRTLRRAGYTCDNTIYKVWVAGPDAQLCKIRTSLEALNIRQLSYLDIIDPPRFGA